MTLATLEVRWFFDGALEQTGPRVMEWFESGFGSHLGLSAPSANPSSAARGGRSAGEGVPWSAEWRKDRYLTIPGAVDMGLKLREGRLEIKGRDRVLGACSFAPGIEGLLERWTKWSFGGSDGLERFDPWFAAEATGVVRVAKRRVLRQFDVDDDGDPVEVAQEASVARGVHLELTRIRLAGSSTDTHWTLGAEGFPPGDRLRRSFVALVGAAMEHCPVRPLTLEESMSYPEWLGRLHMDQQDRHPRT